jgi:hypothetical protein
VIEETGLEQPTAGYSEDDDAFDDIIKWLQKDPVAPRSRVEKNGLPNRRLREQIAIEAELEGDVPRHAAIGRALRRTLGARAVLRIRGDQMKLRAFRFERRRRSEVTRRRCHKRAERAQSLGVQLSE